MLFKKFLEDLFDYVKERKNSNIKNWYDEKTDDIICKNFINFFYCITFFTLWLGKIRIKLYVDLSLKFYVDLILIRNIKL